jgi:hypothetical protein
MALKLQCELYPSIVGLLCIISSIFIVLIYSTLRYVDGTIENLKRLPSYIQTHE